MITFLLIALWSPFLFIRGLGTYIYETWKCCCCARVIVKLYIDISNLWF